MSDYTVDASVWVSFFDQSDLNHDLTVEFLRKIQKEKSTLFIPSLALVETACAIARRARDSKKGMQVAELMQKTFPIKVISDTSLLTQNAIEQGCGSFLRGADAVYMAVALMTKSSLVAWDEELLKRVSQKITALKPDSNGMG